MDWNVIIDIIINMYILSFAIEYRWACNDGLMTELSI